MRQMRRMRSHLRTLFFFFGPRPGCASSILTVKKLLLTGFEHALGPSQGPSMNRCTVMEMMEMMGTRFGAHGQEMDV